MAATGILSPAVDDLGLAQGAGSALSDQVKDETEENRRKRLLAQQRMSPGAMSLLGPGMGLTGGGI